MSRAELESILESLGAQIVKSVSKNTDVVIVGENPTAHKIEKAKKLGIPIIYIKQETPAD
jgi:DNA ligase (NAD+)